MYNVSRKTMVRVALTLALSSAASRSIAQSSTADIVGTAVDPVGATLSGAHVEARNLQTGEVRRTIANTQGEYTFSALQVGTYTVTVTADKFKTFSAASIEVSAGDRVRVDAHMELGSTSETVTVTSVAPALQTDSSAVGDVVPEKAVQDLPLNGRNYTQLVQVTVGVNAAQPSSIQSGNRNTDRRPTQAYSANGNSEFYNNNLIDGTDNNERSAGFTVVRPSVDAIQEISVMTNAYPAEVGRAAGAVVNVVTKAGTNAFHGDVFEYLRNDALDARDFFARTGAKPELRQNQFGGSIGGPIIKNHTFFFADVEETRRINALTSLYTVPTAFEEAHPGNLTDINQGIVATPNPVALAYFALYPAPNTTGPGGNYQGTSKTTQFITTVDGRVDHHFNDANAVFARYAFNTANTVTPSALPSVNGIQPGGVLNGIAGTSITKTHNAALGYTHIFSANLLTELRVAYTRYDTNSVPLNYGKNYAQQLGVMNANISSIPGTSGLTTMYPIGYSPLGDALYTPQQNTQNTIQANGSVTYTRGNHTIKTGAAVIKRESDGIIQSIPVGGYSFSAIPGLYGVSLKAFLAGRPIVISRGNVLAPQILEFWEPSFYVQDDWRATKSLTLNLGLRYEIYGPPSEKRNRLSNFNLTTLSFVQANDSNKKDGISTGYGNFSPRIGFAWSLPRQTVLRGGFGLSFFPTDSQGIAAPSNAPYVYAYNSVGLGSLNTPLPTPASVDPSTVAGNKAFTSLASKNPNFKTAYIEGFNVEAQKQFGEYVATIGYVGELGRRRLWSTNADVPLPPGAGNATPAYRFATQFPYVTTITQYTNAGYSSYNAMQVQLQRRASHGVTINANYTYARGLDNSTSLSGGSATGELYNNPAYDYGNSDLDVRHRAAISLTYELPFAKTSKGLEAMALKGWQLNSIGYWQTGLPFTVENGVLQANGLSTNNQPGVTSDRPNAVRNPNLSNGSLGQNFDITAFRQQTVGTIGSEGRNQIYGPHDRRIDLSAFKTFNLYREAVLQFRAECFNILNIANFSAPNATITAFDSSGVPTNAGNFGAISTTSPSEIPRQLQFAAKLSF